MNYVTIAGHLGADPEVRFTASGQKVTTFRVAARCHRKGKDETIWWFASAWGDQFDKMVPHFKKGSPIVVIGEMNKPEIFTDREGKPQVSMSLTVLDISFSPFGKPDANASHSQPVKSEMGAAAAIAAVQGKGAASFADDEVPF